MGVTEIFSSIYGLKIKLGLVILLKGRLFQGYMIISLTGPLKIRFFSEPSLLV